MRYLLLLCILAFAATACENKDLCEDGGCSSGGNKSIKVVVNWETQAEARSMRMNIFSQTGGVADYGRDDIPVSGQRTISLSEGASYRPLCYDYYSSQVYFRNETTLESFEAYCPETTRATYNTLATPVPGESTVSVPGDNFYVHSWTDNFDVIFNGEEQLVLNYYPVNKLREFTYRIYNVSGAKNVKDVKGATSGMAATYFFYTDKLTDVRSTVLFENGRTGTDTSNGYEYVEGSFYTFGPVAPYQNRFTIELLSNSNKHYTYYWNVSGQITESMADRAAKLARDGFDILIWNTDTELPEIPDEGGEGGGGGSGSGSGFEIGVSEWDEVEVFL